MMRRGFGEQAIVLAMMLDRYEEAARTLGIDWLALFDEARALARTTTEPIERHIEQLWGEALEALRS